jgi:hypothetical protein
MRLSALVTTERLALSSGDTTRLLRLRRSSGSARRSRVDAQREKLIGQLGDPEATERVLARYSKGAQANRAASAKTPTTARKAATSASPRGRPATTTAKPAGGKRTSSNLGDEVLALANGRTQQEITAACTRCNSRMG